MSHEVFISYSSLDKDTADLLCAALEESGTNCWIAPRDVMPGKPYGEALIDAINDSHLMVLVLSEHSNHSQQVVREVERAVSKGIPIIPLRIADVRLAKSLEYFLSTCQWLDAIGAELESHLPRLTEAVNEMLRQCYDGETLRLGPAAAPAKPRAGRNHAPPMRKATARADAGTIYDAELVSSRAMAHHAAPPQRANSPHGIPASNYNAPSHYAGPPRTLPNQRAPSASVRPSGNALGVAGLTTSILGLFTCGAFSPIGLALSLFGLIKAPRGSAMAGSIIGALGSGVFLILFGYGFYGGFFTAIALEDAASEIDSYYMAHGDLPDDHFGCHLIEHEKDAWDRPCRYCRTWTGYEVRSAGLDGQFDTSDDHTVVR